MIHQLTDRAIAVEVPNEDGMKFFVTQIALKEIDLVWRYNDGRTGFKPLPYGKWSILGRGSEITKEQAKKIVVVTNGPHYGGHGQEYFPMYKTDENSEKFDSALKCFYSLLKSKSLDKNSIIILIKEQ